MVARKLCRVVGGAVAGLTLLGAAAGARASTIIGVDFYDGNSGTPTGSSTNQTPGTSAVVGPYASAGWNNEIDPSTAPSSTFTLTDSTGTATTAQLKFTQSGNTLSGNPIYNTSYGAAGSANATYTPDQQLYNGAIVATPNLQWSQQLVLTNIPYASYSVYFLVYAPRTASDTPNVVGSLENFNGGTAGGAGTTYYFQNSNQVNALIPPAPVVYTQATGTSLATATNGADYVVFSGLTNASETFDLLNLGSGSYQHAISLGAFEIVDTSGSAVPEPGTVGVLGISGGLLLLRRRRGVAG